MDSLTHIALGACIGEAFFEKGFGKKAMWWGILAQSIPDIDFVAAWWSDIPDALMAHRGFTHSFLFALLIVPYFSLTADKWHRPHDIRFSRWLLFFGTEVGTHLFLDSLNSYGIGWLEPFDHTRFAFNLIYVADPFFSIIPIIACVALLALNRHHMKRAFWWKMGIIIPVVYLIVCVNNKLIARHQLLDFLERKRVNYSHYSQSPAPLQNLLWYDVVTVPGGYLIGYQSLFENRDSMVLNKWNKNEPLLNEVNNHESLQKLIRFSKNQFIISKNNDSIIFSDIRFGQINGWKYPTSPFVFEYYLNHGDNSRLRIQKARWKTIHFGEISNYFKSVLGIRHH